MDQLAIPGFGTELLRVDFLTNPQHAVGWTEDSAASAKLRTKTDVNRTMQLQLANRLLDYIPNVSRWPEQQPEETSLPWFHNLFLSASDMLGLYGLIQIFRPSQYFEIGSGMSTRVASASIMDANLTTEITCIDPSPRLPIKSSAIKHIQAPLETQIDTVLANIKPGSILFFDGSHRSFPGSDVTLFFLHLLPCLPAGVIVHIHDIFLPFDYPQNLRNRFWSEQYLLASWLLGGACNIEILLAGRSLQDELIKNKEFSMLHRDSRPANDWSSFWFKTI